MHEPELDVELLMDAIPDGLVLLDASCRIRRWNKAMVELTGYTSTEAVGRLCSFLECRDPRTGERIDVEKRCVFSTDTAPTSIKQFECTIRAKSGEDIPIMKNGQVLRDAAGRATGFVETVTDLRPVKQLERELATLRHDAVPVRSLGPLVGSSRAMLDVYDRIRLAAGSDVTVLVEGETGTGKELVARAIHSMSARSDSPLVTVNCSALSENLLESELFGHVKGAFTGATADKAGRIEMAEGGTLFLDEIGDISPLIQLKLLRVLQEHEYERVGESTTRKANVRFLAATHRKLKQRVSEGAFREDFYYRIRVFSIAVPPLRERREDIPLLCDAFIRKLNRSTGRRIKRLSHEATHCFMDYCWPGNVRELENAIEHAFVTCHHDCIERDDLPYEIRSAYQREIECRDRLPSTTAGQTGAADTGASRQFAVSSAPAATPLTRDTLVDMLQACHGNKSEAARRLGINRTTVWRKMKQWGLDTLD